MFSDFILFNSFPILLPVCGILVFLIKLLPGPNPLFRIILLHQISSFRAHNTSRPRSAHNITFIFHNIPKILQPSPDKYFILTIKRNAKDQTQHIFRRSFYNFYQIIEDIYLMAEYIFGTLSFINQKILRRTKQDSVNLAGVATILWAEARYEFKHALKFPLKLQYPNNTLQFPLPNRWSNPDPQKSKQPAYLVKKQIGLNLKPSKFEQMNEIITQQDISLSTINTMGFLNSLHIGQIQNIHLIQQKFGYSCELTYLPERELLFADSMVNGQVTYMLRKYGTEYYQLPQSKKIDEDYRHTFQKMIEKETWNQNSLKFGLQREDIIRRIKERDGVYTMLFEHMQKQSKGEVISTIQQLYIQNTLINQEHFLHVSYPIFLRVKTAHNTTGFICIAIALRRNKKVQIFSPFFASQQQALWRLVQSHLSQLVLNDFAVRVHLGLYHFTTHQYHVPVYKCLGKLRDKRIKQNFDKFVDHSYAMFSKGLEGVNVAATASLVHPLHRYALCNKALNIDQDMSARIIAQTSNNIKIYDFNPRTILANQGISQEEACEYFTKAAFDFQLYDILSNYVEGVYKAFKVEQVEEKLFQEINQQTKNMAVGEGNRPRPQLRSREDVLTTLKNLCFTWVGFHSHTFSVISIGTYALMRPSMLKKPIPKLNNNQNTEINIGDELPHPLILMETGKLNQATTQRDSDNFLMDNIRRQAEAAAFFSKKYEKDLKTLQLSKSYRQLEQIAWTTFKDLQKYQDKILAQNRQRRQKTNSISLEWMIPSKIQTSLNI